MIALTIVRPDGSIYWVEHFSAIGAAQAWVAEEQTRPYWNPAWTFAIVDQTPAPQPGAAMAALRNERDSRLAGCDWTQMPDSPLGADAKAAWAAYRQQLRNLPDQAGLDLNNPTWPTAPGGAA